MELSIHLVMPVVAGAAPMASAFLSAFVVTCLMLSAVFKWREQESFRVAIGEFSLLQWLPEAARSLLVRLVPALEASVATLIVIPQTRDIGSVGAVVLVAGFVVVVALDSRPTIAHCGCWGVASADIPRGLYLARSVLLLLAAVAASILSLPRSGDAAWDPALEIQAIALTAPFALFLLELPQIAQVVRIQQLARGEGR